MAASTTRKRTRTKPPASSPRVQLNSATPISVIAQEADISDSLNELTIARILGAKKYDPEIHPAVVLFHMMQGASQSELCLELGVSPSTIRNWKISHPDFAEAIELGIIFAKAWWLKMGRENITNPKFNSVLWLINMANRFGWRRKDDVTPAEDNPEAMKAEVTKQLNIKQVLDDPSAIGKIHKLLKGLADADPGVVRTLRQ